MKKMICVVLVISMLISVLSVGVYATSYEEELASAFFDYCGGNEIDWEKVPPWEKKVFIREYAVEDGLVFFNGTPGWIAANDTSCTAKFGDWCIYTSVWNHPYSLALYVKFENTIYTLEEAWEKGLVSDLTCIEGFSKHVFVYPVGDVDLDFDISILDATLIQQKIAKLVGYNRYVQTLASDVDGDGEITVLDATEIQRKLAGV